jgi:hypothetical protein
MSSNRRTAPVSVIGIDIGKTRFTSSAKTNVARSCHGRSGHVGTCKRGSPTYRRA